MARRVSDEANEDPQDEREAIPACSICDGRMVLAYDRYQQKVCVCADCNTSISIPGSAWSVAGAKRAARPAHGLERRRQYRRATDSRLQ